jgi:anti-sigma B factor antagonist
MKIGQQIRGAVTLIKPEGPLTAESAAEFEKTARAVLVQSLGRFVIDMSAVPLIDSAGLERLLDLTDSLSESGKTLKLCGVNKTIRQVLEITEIDSLFDHFDDLNGAIRSFL